MVTVRRSASARIANLPGQHYTDTNNAAYFRVEECQEQMWNVSYLVASAEAL